MSKQINPVQEVWIFFENREVLNFSYKIAKTANSETALTSDNTWIWRLKFILRVQNESYSILLTHFFDFKRKWFHMYRAIKYKFTKTHFTKGMIDIAPQKLRLWLIGLMEFYFLKMKTYLHEIFQLSVIHLRFGSATL